MAPRIPDALARARAYGRGMTARVLALCASLLLLAAAPAHASIAGDVAAGRQVAPQVGSCPAYEAMDERMQRMHDRMGRRYAGCRDTANGPLMRGRDATRMQNAAWRGPGMMRDDGMDAATVAAIVVISLALAVGAMLVIARRARPVPR
jgi:hypothetical protein